MASLGGSGKWPLVAVCPDPTAAPCTADGGDTGALSLNASVNPDWYDANAVFVGYCDGGSFAGHRDAPLPAGPNGTLLYLRGRLILDALLEDLRPRMAGALDVVIKGCSAGGLATYIHAARLSAFGWSIPGVQRVAVLPGAGAFLDIASYPGPNIVRPFFAAWSTLHNVSGSLDPECLAQPPEPGKRFLCVFPQYFLARLIESVPLFVSNSLVDWSQQSWVMNLGCDLLNPAQACNSSQLAYVNHFRQTMIQALSPVLRGAARQHGDESQLSSRCGAFLATCSIHIIVDNDGAWSGIRVQGQTQLDTFRAWFTNSTTAKTAVVDGLWDSNPTCKLYLFPSWALGPP